MPCSGARWAVHLGLLNSAAAALGTLQLLHVRIAIHTDAGLLSVGPSTTARPPGGRGFQRGGGNDLVGQLSRSPAAELGRGAVHRGRFSVTHSPDSARQSSGQSLGCEGCANGIDRCFA